MRGTDSYFLLYMPNLVLKPGFFKSNQGIITGFSRFYTLTDFAVTLYLHKNLCSHDCDGRLSFQFHCHPTFHTAFSAVIVIVAWPFYFTVTLHFTLTFAAVIVIVALPFFLAVIFPPELTAATFLFDDL